MKKITVMLLALLLFCVPCMTAFAAPTEQKGATITTTVPATCDITFISNGGKIEEGETPEQAVLRELKEETGLDGKIVRPLTVQYKGVGIDYSFEVEIPEDAVPTVGFDPEFEGEDAPLKEVLWMSLDEISEKNRAFLWSYGLMQVDGFFDKIKDWGNEISYPGEDKQDLL